LRVGLPGPLAPGHDDPLLPSANHGRAHLNHCEKVGIGAGAIFFVSNDKTGTLTIEDSTLPDDPSDGLETAGFPGIFYLGQGRPVVTSSTLG
jgi:hypothetical protein